MSDLAVVIIAMGVGALMVLASASVVRVVLEIEDRRLARRDEEEGEEALWIEPVWNTEVKEEELWEIPEF